MKKKEMSRAQMLLAAAAFYCFFSAMKIGSVLVGKISLIITAFAFLGFGWWIYFKLKRSL